MTREEHWVFGYGSLIYKVDFPYLDREVATLEGWARRFWQGSHDHRGTPEAPGRVVTLIPQAGAVCRGIAYRVDASVFTHLDHREKNGYARHRTPLRLDRHTTEVGGVLYVADEHNPAFLGHDEDTALVRQIAASHGPSGSNADYLLHLAAALRALDDYDEHVLRLERELLRQRPDLALPPT